MANSFVEHLGDGSTTNFAVPFPYLDKEHVTVLVDGVDTSFTWTNDSTVQITPAPALDAIVRVRRNSSPTTRLVDYQTPSILAEEDLDLDSEQAFFLAQEAVDRSEDSIGRTGANWDAQGLKITNVAAPEGGSDVVTYTWVYGVFKPEMDQIKADTILARDVAITATTNNAAAAAASEASAQLLFDNFDRRYLGSFSTPPTTDNKGNALVAGALYFDEDPVTGGMRVFYNGAWETAYLPATGYLSTSDIASEAEARAATDNTKVMTPLRVLQLLDSNLDASEDAFFLTILG